MSNHGLSSSLSVQCMYLQCMCICAILWSTFSYTHVQMFIRHVMGHIFIPHHWQRIHPVAYNIHIVHTVQPVPIKLHCETSSPGSQIPYQHMIYIFIWWTYSEPQQTRHVSEEVNQFVWIRNPQGQEETIRHDMLGTASLLALSSQECQLCSPQHLRYCSITLWAQVYFTLRQVALIGSSLHT